MAIEAAHHKTAAMNIDDLAIGFRVFGINPNRDVVNLLVLCGHALRVAVVKMLAYIGIVLPLFRDRSVIGPFGKIDPIVAKSLVS